MAVSYSNGCRDNGKHIHNSIILLQRKRHYYFNKKFVRINYFELLIVFKYLVVFITIDVFRKKNPENV